ncbi:Sca4 family protein [Candidatus Tisiphia endosymbiont of Hybos culiciformis]|uniref:Sca4 family protein n=1 Tax=Candidatus Tisiphia endosymbiont of Hybos culiciformis TaxID=3139331 RepID=UPI003CCB0069
MKDKPPLLTPNNIPQENSNEVIEQTEESQDLFILTDSANGSFLGIEELDPITEAIRQEILQKQRDILREYISQNHDATVAGYEDKEFAEYLKNVNNRAIIDQAFANAEVKAELERTEITGYKTVHHNFANQFHTMNWQDGDRQGNVRSQIVRNDSGDELATIKETTHKINAVVSLSDGTVKQINSYRTIDFPTELASKNGSMHLSLAVQDENGRNIAKDRAVYFTAHYDSQGKLSEISSPKPVRFNGEGDEAIGYIEHLGHVYSLPVTQGKYREMMIALEKNKGQEIDFSQTITTAQDMMITANTVNNDLPVQEEKKYHHDRQTLAEETLEKTVEHYELAKRQAESISRGMQLTEKSNNVANRQLFEKMSENYQCIHDMSPEQAIVKYQTILDELQPETDLRDQQRGLLQQLAEQDTTLAVKSVAEHYVAHAVAYQQEKTADASSTALEELENIVKVCGGYEKLGLTPVEKQLALKIEEKESIKTGKPLAENKARDESLETRTEVVKKTDRMIGKFMSRDSSSNTPPPLNTSKLQLNNTQVNRR